MKTLTQFEKFYSKELLPDLTSFDNERKQIKSKYSFKAYGVHLLIMVVCVVLVSVYLSGKKGGPVWVMGLMFFITVIYAIGKPIFIFMKRNTVYDKINLKYKHGVIKKLVDFLDSELVYKPDESLPSDKFDLRTCYARIGTAAGCTSQDLVSGKLDGASFWMADIQAHGMPLGVSGRDNRISFFGTYSVIELDKSFTGSCHISHRNEIMQSVQSATESIEKVQSKIHGFLGAVTGQDANSFNRRLPENYMDLETESTAFNRVFDVLVTEQNSSSSLFTTEFLSEILKIYEDEKISFSLTIKKNELHIYFDGNNQFDSDVHADILNPESRFSVYRNYNVVNVVARLSQVINKM